MLLVNNLKHATRVILNYSKREAQVVVKAKYKLAKMKRAILSMDLVKNLLGPTLVLRRKVTMVQIHIKQLKILLARMDL